MSLKRGSVLGALVLCLVLVGTVDAQAQGNSDNSGMRATTATLEAETSSLRAQVEAMQQQLNQALANLAQLQSAVNAMGGGGVTQAVLDAAIAAEASLRSTADAALEGQIENEADARATADATLAPLSSVTPLTALVPLASYVKVETGAINGLAGPHVIFNGANVHVRNGDSSGDSFVANGLGNFVVGYNEPVDGVPMERGGSHNLVVGSSHRYNFGVGLIVGHGSRLGAQGASVSGGYYNTASGLFSSVSGGSYNTASGQSASVLGGDSNHASGNTAAISAGGSNTASGDLSSVSGGASNTASASFSTVGGGSGVTADVLFSFKP